MLGTQQAVGAIDNALTTIQQANDNVYNFGLNSSLQFFRILGESVDKARGRDNLVEDILSVLVVTGLVLLAVVICLFLPNLEPKFLSGQRLDSESSMRFSMRLIFVLSATAWIYGTMLGTQQAVGAIDTTVTTIQQTNDDVYSFGLNSSVQFFRMLGVSVDKVRGRDNLVEDILSNTSGFVCDGAVDYVRNETGIDLSVRNISSPAFTNNLPIIDALEQLDTFLDTPESESIQEGLDDLRSVTFKLQMKIETFQEMLSTYSPLIIMVPFFFVAIPLVFGTLIGLVGGQLPCYLEKTISHFFLPLLVILTVVAAIVTSILSVTASANENFCSPPNVVATAVNLDSTSLFLDVKG
eukprot:CAMPEP_0194160254 /NCGR_PEP_ID=MMETSP0152-20130528/78289_1 /TAXON_ID=1049557 /ORGANISM="Thalassiothrix antarctica, Strain L6-D1" /LENGTH=352 /DNA_ID=CAMNT_0038869921 /DNA_START=288 /DNA_END=1342 /DNA_ORIENTATION=-